MDIASGPSSADAVPGGAPGTPPVDAALGHELERTIQRAASIAELASAAAAVRRDARAAVARGDDALATTQWISGLNDKLTVEIVRRIAAELGRDLNQACWLVFGSQARAEQTIATDQDNGLVFASRDPVGERSRWLELGERINRALAACGYPLCRGRVMAGQPLCCLTAQEWCARFDHWMAHGNSNDLLAARIFFDVRPVAGNATLAAPLTERLLSPAASVPRLLKQMADIVLCNRVPLNWFGGLVAQRHAGRAMIDLKMSGTALFVDAARLWALAFAIPATATVARLHAAARALHVPEREVADWCAAFATLLRLRMQAQTAHPEQLDPEECNWVAPELLSAAQRNDLKRALRAARWVQQRIALEYRR